MERPKPWPESDKFVVVEPGDEEKYQGKCWGDQHIYISFEQIRALMEGKTLFNDDGEYGLFVSIDKKEFLNRFIVDFYKVPPSILSDDHIDSLWKMFKLYNPNKPIINPPKIELEGSTE